MRVGKKHPTLGQSIKIWGMHSLAPTHAIDPVIEIVNRDKEHIWAFITQRQLAQ